MPPRMVHWCLLAGIVLAPSPAGAQPGRVAQADTPPRAAQADSGQVRRGAREAQADFERFRYRRLDHTNSGHGDAERLQVGRYYYWFGGDPRDIDPPAEPPAVTERRGQFIAALDRAATRLPGDGWIAGQRVRYLAEAGEHERAIAAARDCRAEAGWCAALHGFALHEAGRFREAESAFTQALALLPADERARWTSVDELLWPADVRVLREMAAAERAAVERRLWWLADPMWSEPGNDRLTEHYARWVMHRIQRDARQIDRSAWNDDARAAVIRYGWSRAWALARRAFVGTDPGDIVIGYTGGRSWEFMPPLRAARNPAQVEGDAWPTEETAATWTRYRPAYARHGGALPHQWAVFRRGQAAELVAGFTLADTALPERPRVRAALVAMADVDAEPALARTVVEGASGALRLTLPAGPTVLSLEARDDSARVVGRRREAMDVRPGARISDLLLLADPAARPSTLEQAAPLARGDATAAPGEPLALFWEIYDLRAGSDSVGIGVRLVPTRGPGWGRRQLEGIGLARTGQPVRLRWNEAAAPAPVIGRALGIALPGHLRPGEYVIELTVHVPGEAPAITRREITIAPDRARRTPSP